MNNYYPYILGILDTLNDLNEKLNKFAGSHLDNVWVGAATVGAIFVVAAWGISVLYKR